MALPEGCEPFMDCDLAKLSLEQLFKRYFIKDDGFGCPTLVISTTPAASSFREVEINSSIETADGNVPAGAKFVSFTTSDDFTGTINGVIRQNSLSYPFEARNNDTTPVIPYTITAGSITIDSII